MEITVSTMTESVISHWEHVRARYVEALGDLSDVAAEVERAIAAESLILLGLHGTATTNPHFHGSQFGSKTWMYSVHVDGQSNMARLEVSIGANDRLQPVAGPGADPARMLIFLEDAPRLINHLRLRVEEIRDNFGRAVSQTGDNAA